PSPASSMSWPRPPDTAFATAIRIGATWARVCPRPDRCQARRPGCIRWRSVRTTRNTLRCREFASFAARSPSSTTTFTGRIERPSTRKGKYAFAVVGAPPSRARAVAALGHINLGHFLPDYTAYEELLDIFKLFTAIPILLDPANGYHFGVDELRREIAGRGLSALLLSNPCNPTGKVIQGAELEAWVNTARELQCSLLIDEFYSHYIWSGGDGDMVSAARYVQDVESDPVVLF